MASQRPGYTEGRFWSKVDIRSDDKCWEWTASVHASGYGRFMIGSRVDGTRRQERAHRVAWMLYHGEGIPDGACICHHCDNPACCNPNHLFLGTRGDNAADRDAKGRGVVTGNAKITAADALEIRRLWAETDLYQREIAEMFGITQGHVGRIVRRKRGWLQ